MSLLVQIRISTSDIADVALEVLDIHRVESNNGRIEPDIHLCHTIAEVVWPSVLGQICLCSIERLEEDIDILLIRFLRSEYCQKIQRSADLTYVANPDL